MTFALNSNGLSLTKSMAEFLVEQQVDSIMFSIDAVTPETLKKIRGIKNLSALKRRCS